MTILSDPLAGNLHRHKRSIETYVAADCTARLFDAENRQLARAEAPAALGKQLRDLVRYADDHHVRLIQQQAPEMVCRVIVQEPSQNAAGVHEG